MIEVDNKALKDYKFIDLFCGIGGFHLALSSFGAKCVFASDIDKNAREVYKKNFKMEPYGDITKIGVEDIPKHDIICAGFPCQPFSISGQQQGFNDNRGKLFYEIIRIASHHKPKIILLENVKNLEIHGAGETLKKMKEALENIGYNVFSKVLIASDFGIPQARERLYILALRNDLNINKFTFPNGDNKKCKLVDLLFDEADKYDVQVKREYIINPIPLKRKGLIQVARIGKGRQGERIYSTEGLATTLSSQSGGLGGKTGMYVVNGSVRKLYPRECARLMGFPDEFEYAESISIAQKQFGNSVVVNVLQFILFEILKHIQ